MLPAPAQVSDWMGLSVTHHLGEFEVLEIAGSGAFADVWLARHRQDGYPTAIKIPRRKAMRSQPFDEQFLREVRAIAQLDHPGVIKIWEQDRLSQPQAFDSAHQYPAQTPYFVMEWVSGGTLRSAMQSLDWTTLRGSLLMIFDALAAAHARGIIHRDIKPDNILLAERGPILTDFGIAFSEEMAEDEALRASIQGTPSYMAPEQILRDVSALGPWTDLYAVGCLTYFAVTGQKPFRAQTFSEMARAHLLAKAPPLKPCFPVPEGLEGWIAKLMRKSHHDRFQFAADAALALLQLENGVANILKPAEEMSCDLSPVQLTRETLMGSTLAAEPIFAVINSTLLATHKLTQDVPKVPASWADSEVDEAPRAQPGLGRSLFAWSNAKFVGRESERDTLWGALKTARDDQKLSIVGIFGQPGMGKSALAKWLVEKAHSTGVAQPFQMFHELPNGPRCGLRGMVRRALRVVGLSPHDAEAALAALCERESLSSSARALGDLLAANESPENTHRVTVQERFAAVANLLAVACRRRTVILLVDDLQWGDEALEFLSYLRSDWSNLPLLVVTTVRSDLINVHHPLMRNFEKWSRGMIATLLWLAPMTRAQVSQMVCNRLSLNEQLLGEVLDRTQGNPLFLEALLNHWIEDGALVFGKTGFRIQGSAALKVPASINNVWYHRLSELVEVDGEAWQSLELAAVLGLLIDPAEWSAVCEAVNLPTDYRLISRLERRDLVENQRQSGWSFKHVLFRDFLMNHAKLSGRYESWQAHCGRMLITQKHTAYERIGGHLVSAGCHDEAILPLRNAMLSAFAVHDYAGMKRLTLLLATAYRKTGVKVVSRVWQLMTTFWQFSHRVTGNLDRALRQSKVSVHRAEQTGDRIAIICTLLEHSICLGVANLRRDAIAVGEQARIVADAGDELDLQAIIRLRLFWYFFEYDEYEAAERHMLEARALTEDNPDLRVQFLDTAVCLMVLYTATNRLEESRQIAREIAPEMNDLENGFVCAQWHRAMALIHMESGDLKSAKLESIRALDEAKRIGHLIRWKFEMYLADLMGKSGDWGRASSYLEQAEQTSLRFSSKEGIAVVSVFRLHTHIQAARWQTFDDTLARLRLETNAPFTMATDLMAKAAQMLSDAGMWARAERTWQLAAKQFQMSGRAQKESWAKASIAHLRREHLS